MYDVFILFSIPKSFSAVQVSTINVIHCSYHIVRKVIWGEVTEYFLFESSFVFCYLKEGIHVLLVRICFQGGVRVLAHHVINGSDNVCHLL